MDEKQALEYAANALDAEALMRYGFPLESDEQNKGFRAATEKLRSAAGDPEWRGALEQQGGFGKNA